MQIPVIPDSLTGTAGGRGNSEIPFGVSLSIKSQLRLRSFYQYVDSCRDALDEIAGDLLLIDSGDGDAAHLQRALEKLERLCVEADSWGFDSLYEVALGLQVLLLNSGGCIQGNGCRIAMQRGLKMLAALLEQCERDFCCRLATADTLDYLVQATRE